MTEKLVFDTLNFIYFGQAIFIEDVWCFSWMKKTAILHAVRMLRLKGGDFT